jgi:Tol biopolymer transport system component
VRRRRQFAILGSVAAGVLLGGLAAGVLLRPRAAEPPSFQVLTYSGDDTQPSVSPDGKTIAFTSLRDGRSRIWIKQLAGGGEAALTEGPDMFPRFSPDGSAVLFVRQVADTRVTLPGPSMTAESLALYRVPLVGGEVRKIVGQATEGDWSPDGREIGFLRVDLKEGKVESSVHRVAVDGTNERMVARVADRVLLRLCWSPDGLTLAAIEVPGAGTGRPRIVLFPLDGKAPRHLEAPESGSVLGFTWNGDGRHLIFLGGGSETGVGSRTTRVFMQGTRTGKARALLSGIDLRGAVDVLGPESLLLVTGGRRSNLREVSLTKPGEAGRWLTRGSSVDRQPVYAPDGEWVAFTSNRSGNNDIWEVSTKSGAVRRLTDDPAEDFDPAFTSDGKHLLFSSNRSGHFEIWIAERDGDGARRVSADGVDAENPTATPDGQWIVYTSHNPKKRGVWKVRADGSAAFRLVAGAGTVALAEISPDGRLVSYATQGGIIRVVRFEDGAPVPFEVTAPVPGADASRVGVRGRHRWMPGGVALVFPEKGHLGIAAQDFTPGRDTSATRRLLTGFTPDSWTESLGVAPDGTRLTVSELQDSASLLLAEGVDGVVARTARGAKQP